MFQKYMDVLLILFLLFPLFVIILLHFFKNLQYNVVWATGRRLELNKVVVDGITGAGLGFYVVVEW